MPFLTDSIQDESIVSAKSVDKGNDILGMSHGEQNCIFASSKYIINILLLCLFVYPYLLQEFLYSCEPYGLYHSTHLLNFLLCTCTYTFMT